MSFGEDDGGSEVELETLHGRSWPTVTQYSVFLENRVGQLLDVYRSFQGSRVKIVGLTISDSADCSILAADREPLRAGARNPGAEQARFCGKRIAGGRASRRPAIAFRPVHGALAGRDQHPLCLSVARAPANRAAVAMHIDNVEQASVTLHNMGFEVLCEADLA